MAQCPTLTLSNSDSERVRLKVGLLQLEQVQPTYLLTEFGCPQVRLDSAKQPAGSKCRPQIFMNRVKVRQHRSLPLSGLISQFYLKLIYC